MGLQIATGLKSSAPLSAPLRIAQGLGPQPGGGDVPVPPVGFLFLVKSDGTYLTNQAGAYLLRAA
jgi:hypothetical protein